MRHPEDPAYFSRARDLARFSSATLHARSLAPLVKALGFGMTPGRWGGLSCYVPHRRGTHVHASANVE